jgi:hypothetical protein
MEKTEYLFRLKVICQLLKEDAHDCRTLLLKLSSIGIHTQKNQIHLDISSISKNYLRENEQLIETLVNKQKKVWKVVEISTNPTLTEDEVYKLSIIRNTLPVNIEDNFIINKIGQLLAPTFDKKPELIQLINSKDKVFYSNFYEKNFNEKEFGLIKEFYDAIALHKKINIKKRILDATCINPNRTDLLVKPISIIRHRGSMFLAGFTGKETIIILDVCQIIIYNVTNERFRNHSTLVELLKNELSKRFGISDNMDDEVYDIEIEFSKETGEYLKHFIWHPTQKFKITNTGYILTMKCGINRELVGWVFQFMNNVRILQPEKLRILYLQQLKRMMDLNTNNMTLKYSNIFLKKG